MARESVQEKKARAYVENVFGKDSYLKDGKSGNPDRQVFCGSGLHFWVEWKTEDGSLTPAQLRRIPKIRQRGDTVYVLTVASDLVPIVAAWSKLAARVGAMLP